MEFNTHICQLPVLQGITVLKKNDSWGLNISFFGVATDKKKGFFFPYFFLQVEGIQPEDNTLHLSP